MGWLIDEFVIEADMARMRRLLQHINAPDVAAGRGGRRVIHAGGYVHHELLSRPSLRLDGGRATEITTLNAFLILRWRMCEG